MSEYKISSAYFSRKNKILLLICVFFFSCSTHIFKNAFPFLFMLTGVRNEINTNKKTACQISKLLYSKKGSDVESIIEDNVGISAKKDRNGSPWKEHHVPTIGNTYLRERIFLLNKVRQNITNNGPYSCNENDGKNSKSIYLYSNILSLIYCSSLLTYIFILIFDLGKNNYFINSIYIVNLISHFIIFLILSDIQSNNTNLNHDLDMLKTVQNKKMIHVVVKPWDIVINQFENYNDEIETNQYNNIFQNRKKINLLFRKNLQDRLDSKKYLAVGPLEMGAMKIIQNFHLIKKLWMVEKTGTYSRDKKIGSIPTIWRKKRLEKNWKDEMEVTNSKGGKKNSQGDKRYEIEAEEGEDEVVYTYERNYLNYLYLFIIISSICSGYIKIYQKKIMYCIFYVNIGVITSLLILMNNLFKLLAHSLNYVVTNNNSNTDISDYIILFLFIDMFGLLMILIFTYNWFYQKTLWINMHTIFYNYKYICFYHSETYYIYSVDKNIDNILVHIDLCQDKNIQISFCAYMNLQKSIFYDYFRLNTFRKNKLRIIQIDDPKFEVKSTYKGMDSPNDLTSTQNGLTSSQNGLTSAQKGLTSAQNGLTSTQNGLSFTPNGKCSTRNHEHVTPKFTRKQNHSYTMKPYKICIESFNMLNPNSVETTDKESLEINASQVPLTAGHLNTEVVLTNAVPSHCNRPFEDSAYNSNDDVNEEVQVGLEKNTSSFNRGDVRIKNSSNENNQSCIRKQGKKISKGDSVHFLDQHKEGEVESQGEAEMSAVELSSLIYHDRCTQGNAGDKGDFENCLKKKNHDSDCFLENSGNFEKEEKKNVLLIPNYEEEGDIDLHHCDEEGDIDLHYCDEEGDIDLHYCDKKGDINLHYSDEEGDIDLHNSNDFELSHNKDESKVLFMKKRNETFYKIKHKILKMYENIKIFLSSFTFYFFFFIFIYAFLLSVMHIFINYFFYIYLFVFNINIYVSNVYTIIMTFVSLIAIPFSGYIIDNIGSFLSLLLCSSSFILIAISGSIYCYKFNMNSEALAFLFFNLIGISESIIPTVIISQIPTHLCVKNNENITSAFAIFELVTMIIISINNYVFGCFLIKEEYLKGLYILLFFVILVIILIFFLIITIYLKKKQKAHVYMSPRNSELAQPLL
ncbi:hypothetical protein, conserved [Plasmodium gonderi]|uniref:Transporter n=1 Tax=Plasmodium gonderi TaxID=77519 RepID=A0A1Y1JH11_PLAGO|nr:hypothetical protein, conserved [Plasmodium gonderi]GAW80938.1 hypothetical protein, conserved [Plasmodium gonderi]